MKTYDQETARQITANIEDETFKEHGKPKDIDYYAKLSGKLLAYTRVLLSHQTSPTFFDFYLDVNYNKETILPKTLRYEKRKIRLRNANEINRCDFG